VIEANENENEDIVNN